MNVKLLVLIERPIQNSIIHSFLNYMPLTSSIHQPQSFNASQPNTDQLQILNASIIPPGGVAPIFENVSISIPRGKLTVVIGLTASGKSQFLKSLLGEVEHMDGQLFIEKGTSIAYCDQTVWLQHKSIKDNILSGQLLDEERYQTIVERCELQQDFYRLPHGDQTIITSGAKNLSISQQHKIVCKRSLVAFFLLTQ